MPSTVFAAPSMLVSPRSRPGSHMSDIAHTETAAKHNARWLPWLAQKIGKLGLIATPSVANFVLVHFPIAAGRTAGGGDAFLSARGLILRRLETLRLTNALRLSV